MLRTFCPSDVDRMQVVIAIRWRSGSPFPFRGREKGEEYEEGREEGDRGEETRGAEE